VPKVQARPKLTTSPLAVPAPQDVSAANTDARLMNRVRGTSALSDTATPAAFLAGAAKQPIDTRAPIPARAGAQPSMLAPQTATGFEAAYFNADGGAVTDTCCNTEPRRSMRSFPKKGS
jgi:hypothetical protein